MTTLDGFDVDRTGWEGSGSFTEEVDLLTLHTTEGDGFAGALATLHGNHDEPHVLCEIRAAKGRRKSQLVDIDKAAKSLRNLPGGIQTNRNGTLQIELVGFAAHPEAFTEEDWLWYGREVVGPMCRAKGIPLAAPLAFHPYPPPGERLGSEPWRTAPDGVKGIVGHQHWRENAHGDPGDYSTPIYRNDTASPMDLILEGAGATTHPAPAPEDQFMPKLTDDEQADLYAKVKELHADLAVNRAPVPGKANDNGNSRWKLGRVFLKTVKGEG